MSRRLPSLCRRPRRKPNKRDTFKQILNAYCMVMPREVLPGRLLFQAHRDRPDAIKKVWGESDLPFVKTGAGHFRQISGLGYECEQLFNSL